MPLIVCALILIAAVGAAGQGTTVRSDDPAAIAEFVKQELPFGRFGKPEEVGDVVAYLSSSRASWVSGTSVVVDGCQSRAF